MKKSTKIWIGVGVVLASLGVYWEYKARQRGSSALRDIKGSAETLPKAFTLGRGGDLYFKENGKYYKSDGMAGGDKATPITKAEYKKAYEMSIVA